MRKDGILEVLGSVYILANLELKKAVFEEAYSSAYAVYQGSTKMYRIINENYW